MTPADYVYVGLTVMAVLLAAWLVEAAHGKVRR